MENEEEHEGTSSLSKQCATRCTSLSKQCVTRWAVRTTAFEKVINNYYQLMSLWDACLQENLDIELLVADPHSGSVKAAKNKACQMRGTVNS